MKKSGLTFHKNSAEHPHIYVKCQALFSLKIIIIKIKNKKHLKEQAGLSLRLAHEQSYRNLKDFLCKYLSDLCI